MDKGDQELMFGPAYYGDPGVPHGDPELFLTLVYGYLFARAYKWVLKEDAHRDHTSPFDHWLVAENSRLKREWERLRNYKEGSNKEAPSVREMSSAGLPRGKWDRVMMSGHFHMPSFMAYPHDFVYPQEKSDRPSNLPHLIPPHREIPLHDFQANTLEEDEYVLKAMELVGNDDLAPGEEGFDEEDQLAFMRAKLERKKLEMPENQNKVDLNELLEQTLEKDDAWQEEYVQAFSDIDDARLAAQEEIALGLGEEFILEKASQQLPPEKVSDYTEAQLRGEEQIEMKKRVLANPRFDDRGEPLDVKKRREIALGRIQADAEKKREAYVQRVQALESKLDKLDAEANDAEAAGDPAAEKKIAVIEKAEQELQALQDAQSRTESQVKEAIANFEDDDFVLYGKERNPDQEWWDKREDMREEMREKVAQDYYDEDDVEVAHRLYVKNAEKAGIDPIDAEFETDFTPEEQALINFQDETPMYPTLGIVRGNANTELRPQRLVDKSGVVFDTVDEEIRTHSRLTLDPTQEDPRFQEWRYRLLGKEDGVPDTIIGSTLDEGGIAPLTAAAPSWEDFIPVITKPESMLNRFFKKKMDQGMPPIATHDDDITPWGEESSANADLATYVERQLKVTGQKPDEKTLNDLGIGWFTRPDGAFTIPWGARAAYERKERLAYDMYRADVAQRKTGPTFRALSRSEAVDKYFNKLGKIKSELSAGEDEAPVPEFEEIPRYPGYLFASDGSGLGISPSGDYVVAINTSDQLQAKTPKRVMSAAELKKAEPGVDWEGELKALGEAHGVEALAATKEERARILRQNAQRKHQERVSRFKDLDDQDVEFLEASRERLRQRAPQEKRVGGKNVTELYAQHRQFSPLSAWTFINGLRSKKDTEQWNASDQRRRYDLETQGFVTEDAPKEEREHWADKFKLFGPKSLTPLQRDVVRGDQEKKKQDEQKWGVPGHWNMFKKAPREMLQPDAPSAGGRRGGEGHGGRKEENGGIEIFGFRISGPPRDKPIWETRKDKKSDKFVFFPRQLQDEDPRERGIDRSGGKPRRKEFMRDADVRYPRLRDDYGVHEPDVREFLPKARKAELTYEKDEDPVDPEFW